MKDTVPKKSLGQHWLHDLFSLEAMCEAGNLKQNDTVVEIGPGLGTLTELLVKKVEHVVAIEFDKDLAKQLPKRVPADNLQIYNEDCLKFDYSKLPRDYKVVANIPYYLTSNLLRVLSEAINPPKSIILLVQKEVAQRVSAIPGSMSILSVCVQYYYEAHLGLIVPAHLFTPPPKVDSQILILERRKTPLFHDLDQKLYFRIVKAGFSQRRKKLRSSLSVGLRISKAEVGVLLQKAELDENSRPQELSLKQWYDLYCLIDQKT